MAQYPITPEEMRIIRLKEKERERRRIEEYNCYNEELDLWNTTKLAELERKSQFRKIFENK